jgi:enamine deaminase RidA (YjgF/YER057c/UK114 family)
MTRIERESRDGMDVVALTQGAATKYFVTARPSAGGKPFDLFGTVARYLAERKAVVVAQDVFGPCKLHSGGTAELERSFPLHVWPVTWIEGDRGEADALTGTQLYAITDPEGQTRPVRVDGRVVGVIHENHHATYCLLGDLRCLRTNLSRVEQAEATWNLIAAALSEAGLALSDIVRTWLYVDRILEWYGEFNKVRDAFFRKHGMFEGLVPASTGVGVSNPQGAAMVADVLAIRPKHPDVKMFAVPSPLQCPALQYGSSFSRAVEVDTPGVRRLFISGTASIEPGGKTAYVGDLPKQIELSMDVVAAILESRRMGWKDISRAVAYVRNMEAAPVFASYCRTHKLPPLPCAVAHADICRDDLLFEIEADAIVVE